MVTLTFIIAAFLINYLFFIRYEVYELYTGSINKTYSNSTMCFNFLSDGQIFSVFYGLYHVFSYSRIKTVYVYLFILFREQSGGLFSVFFYCTSTKEKTF